MMLETLKQAIGRVVVWEKYNYMNGGMELLRGKLVDAGIAHKLHNVEYAVVEDGAGREWITVVGAVKEIL